MEQKNSHSISLQYFKGLVESQYANEYKQGTTLKKTPVEGSHIAPPETASNNYIIYSISTVEGIQMDGILAFSWHRSPEAETNIDTSRKSSAVAQPGNRLLEKLVQGFPDAVQVEVLALGERPTTTTTDDRDMANSGKKKRNKRTG